MNAKNRDHFRIFTLYDNRTTLPVIVDGSAEECAEYMGIKTPGIYSYITHQKKGGKHRYTIVAEWADEVDDDINE